MHLLPSRDRVVRQGEPFREIFGVKPLQVGRAPGEEVHAVGHVADVQLVLEISGPHAAEDVLAHFAVQPAHAVDLLREVAGQEAHRELFVRIVRIRLAQVDELLPSDAEPVWVVAHVLADHRFGECVVPRRDGRVRREERRGAHHFERFAERKLAFLDQVVDAFDADKGCMALVAMVDVLVRADRVHQPDAADAEQHLLFEAVFPVPSVEVVGDRAVLFAVQVVVGVEQVELGASHVAAPDAPGDDTARQAELDRKPVAVLVADGRDRQFREVLRLIARLLVACGREALREVAVPVKQPHGDHRYVFVAGLLEVVAREDAEAAGIDFQRAVDAVFHAEIADLRPFRIFFLGHVGFELLVGGVHLREENLVFLELQQARIVQLVEEVDRVLFAGYPQVVIDVLPHFVGLGVPRPPEVFRQLFERVQPFGQRPFDHQPSPGRAVADELLADEVDLFVLVASALVFESGTTLGHPGERDVVGVRVIGVQVLPERDFGGFERRFLVRGVLFCAHVAELLDR